MTTRNSNVIGAPERQQRRRDHGQQQVLDHVDREQRRVVRARSATRGHDQHDQAQVPRPRPASAARGCRMLPSTPHRPPSGRAAPRPTAATGRAPPATTPGPRRPTRQAPAPHRAQGAAPGASNSAARPLATPTTPNATSLITPYYVDAQSQTAFSDLDRESACLWSALDGLTRSRQQSADPRLRHGHPVRRRMSPAVRARPATRLPQPGTARPPGFFPIPPVTEQGRPPPDLYVITFVDRGHRVRPRRGPAALHHAALRRRKPTDTELPPQTHGSNPLELLWTIIPRWSPSRRSSSPRSSR